MKNITLAATVHAGFADLAMRNTYVIERGDGASRSLSQSYTNKRNTLRLARVGATPWRVIARRHTTVGGVATGTVSTVIEISRYGWTE